MWIDDDAANSASGVQPHVLPGLARVSGLVHTIADRDIAADESLACAHPYDAVVRCRNRDRADRLRRLLIKYRMPVEAAIGGFPQSPGRRPGVINIRITGLSHDGAHTISRGTNKPVLKMCEWRLRLGLGIGWR